MLVSSAESDYISEISDVKPHIYIFYIYIGGWVSLGVTRHGARFYGCHLLKCLPEIFNCLNNFKFGFMMKFL